MLLLYAMSRVEIGIYVNKVCVSGSEHLQWRRLCTDDHLNLPDHAKTSRFYFN